MIDWIAKAEKLLLGRTIVKIEWMSSEDKRPVCLQLDDKSWIFPVMDDEGNDGGALNYYRAGKTEVLPIIPVGVEIGD